MDHNKIARAIIHTIKQGATMGDINGDGMSNHEAKSSGWQLVRKWLDTGEIYNAFADLPENEIEQIITAIEKIIGKWK